jgi:hypothetical protein
MPPEPRTANRCPSVTAGLIARKSLAADLGRSERTIIRYERAGMPFIKLGMLRFYDPFKVRAWVMTHESRHDAPKRGRPTKRAA